MKLWFAFQCSLFKAAPLQTPSEVKTENEGPLQVDSSPPDSPDSSSSMSDDSRDSRVRGDVPVHSAETSRKKTSLLLCLLTGDPLKASGELGPHSNYCASRFSPPALE